MCQRAEFVELSGDIHLCRDKRDDLLLETAIKGRAHYLVTRDDDVKMDANLVLKMKNYGVLITSVAHFLSMLKD